MVSKTIFVIIGIAVGVFFVGISSGYTIFSYTYNSNTMFQNSQISNQMMQNPQVMQNILEPMMNEPPLRQQMYGMMFQNQQFMQNMMNNSQFQSQWMSSMMGSQNMMGSSMMSQITSDKIPFNPDVPVNIPVLGGNYNGTKVYFIHTEVSDKDIADMMTDMTNFPTLHVSTLTNIPPKDLGKVYVFANGIPRSSEFPRPHGGGPFGFQEDVFDSIPGQEQYIQFKVPQLVKWNEGVNPRILTSVDKILQAQADGELSIQQTDIVVNMPIIVWQSQDGKMQVASEIEKIFITMPDYKGGIVNVNDGNFIVTIKFIR